MQDIIKLPALREAAAVPKGKAALRYEQQERQSFRDCLLFYCDGRVLFERYCYGEAAGLVFSVWVTEITEEGAVYYNEPLSIEVKRDALPRSIKVLPDGLLQVNSKQNLWARAAVLDDDKKNGYSRLKAFFSR